MDTEREQEIKFCGFKTLRLGFPGGLPANAGDMGSSPGPGRSHIPRSIEAHAPQLLSLRSTAHALEPVSHNYWARVPQLLKSARLEPGSATREATAMRNLCTTTKSNPHSPQLEKART